jgi:arylsulfatase
MGLIDKQRYPLSETDSRAYDWDSADQDFEDHRMAVYAAMIDSMDQNIGRLMKTLDELGVADNTVVMFLSDNGGCAEEPGGRDPRKRNPGPVDDYVAVGPAWGWAQNAPFKRHKSWVHEGGVNTPFIVRWPGRVKAGAIDTESVGHIIDLMPTLCELAGADYPKQHAGRDVLPVEGRSLVPVLKGESTPPRTLAWEWAGNRAVREGDWKLVWDNRIKQWELYDLSRNRTETNDQAAKQPDRVERMAAMWFDWADDTGLKVKK